MLPKIINSDQKGFIKAHYMGENIRLISDMMENTKAQKPIRDIIVIRF